MKIKHILKREEFRSILKGGRKLRGKTLSLYVGEKGRQKELSVGVIIPKKSASLAVRRNYLKRLVYGYFRSSGDAWKKGYSVIVRAVQDTGAFKKKPLARTVKEELDRLTQKAGIKEQGDIC